MVIHFFGENGGLSAKATFLFAWGTLGVVVAIRLAWAPFALHRKDKLAAEKLRSEIARLANHQAKADTLNGRHQLGMKLLNEAVSPDSYGDWCNRIDAWRVDLHALLSEQSGAAQADSIVTLGSLPMADMIGSLNSEHNHKRMMLNERLKRLVRLRDAMLARIATGQ